MLLLLTWKKKQGTAAGLSLPEKLQGLVISGFLYAGHILPQS